MVTSDYNASCSYFYLLQFFNLLKSKCQISAVETYRTGIVFSVGL